MSKRQDKLRRKTPREFRRIAGHRASWREISRGAHLAADQTPQPHAVGLPGRPQEKLPNRRSRPRGTGKTWLAATHAADLYRQRRIAKIIVTRPTVPCGRSLGFFPGSLEDKFAPWTAPIVEAIKERIGTAAFEIALKNGDIEMVPFEVMRGRSWKDAFILLDEAQNTTAAEMKVFLTRIGEDCTVVVNGDVSQSDLRETSGLRTVIHLIVAAAAGPVIEFTVDDIVRSGVCEMWVRAFEDAKI